MGDLRLISSPSQILIYHYVWEVQSMLRLRQQLLTDDADKASLSPFTHHSMHDLVSAIHDADNDDALVTDRHGLSVGVIKGTQ